MSSLQRRLTDEEMDDLQVLNAAVKAAIKSRSAWLDAKMHECSRLQVGDDIYDVDKGIRLGVVTELYRFWRDRDDGIRDDTARCDYEYMTASGYRDNTSRQVDRGFGTKEDALAAAEARMQRLQQAQNR
jgi:hypothetical protein